MDEPKQSRALGPDCVVCGHGSASLLRCNPLRLGIGNSTGYERGVPACWSSEWYVDLGTLPGNLRPGGGGTHAWIVAALGRGIPTVDDRPGWAPRTHRPGGGSSLACIGIADRGWHWDMVRPRPDGR